MELAKRYALSDDAVIRHERFGGLVYRYDNRRLYFLHSRLFADFLMGLDGSETLQTSLQRFVEDRGLTPDASEVFVRSLGRLRELEVVREL